MNAADKFLSCKALIFPSYLGNGFGHVSHCPSFFLPNSNSFITLLSPLSVIIACGHLHKPNL
jgi:hypothetical protein